MENRRLIFLEFNELCPSLLDTWMAEGRLPNFQKFYQNSQVFTAEADVPETDADALQPWVQWYSMHTGLSYYQHHVFNLTDGPRAGFQDIWQMLLKNGLTVGNCASMNAAGFRSPGSFYLPDPWCNTEPPYPEELSAYQRVVLTKVQENSNKTATLDKKAYLDFMQFVATHGLGIQSVSAIMKQLFADVTTKESSWKRAALLDKLQTDIFLHYWKKLTPDYSTFFLNSTAHFQHAYFHLLKPEAFELPEEDFHDEVHRDAILFGYQEMDKLLAGFMKLESRGALLVLTTALSQQPNPHAGHAYYRAFDMKALLNNLGVTATALLPVMAHQYSAEFPDDVAAERAREAMSHCRYQGKPMFGFNQAPEGTLYFGSVLHDQVPKDAVVEVGGRTVPFYDIFYKIKHSKSGAHHPDSVLWFKTGQHKLHRDKPSILNILPTVLDYYGLETPDEGSLRRQGTSLLPQLGIERYASQRTRTVMV